MQPEEVNYGSFASHVNDGYLHLVGADDTGFKLARVAPTVEKIGDRNHVGHQPTRPMDCSANELR
jgi:hypothetical protein